MQKRLSALLKEEIDPAFAQRAEYIFHQIEKYRPQIVLDAGCGRGFYLFSFTFFRFIKKIHGVDLNASYLKIAQKNIKDKRVLIKKANLYHLPYQGNTFDFIICSEVIEHLKEDDKGIAELKRILKPGGKLIITVPNLDFPFLWDPLNWILMKLFHTHIPKNIWWLAGIWADHERLYHNQSLTKLVKKHRFTIVEKTSILHYCLPFSHFLLYGIGKNLVETLKLNQFNRFHFKKKPLALLIAFIFQLPSRIYFLNKKYKRAVNLSFLLTKRQ